jgi:hypothetical protein
MTGLKSGAGDDLWDDDADPADENTGSTEDTSKAPEPAVDDTATSTTDTSAERESTMPASDATSESRSYIVRRAIQDKSVQFERDERLTFFVHDDVVDGERDLITEVESTLGRNVPKFDVREAVYRAALRHRDDVLDELLNMGYSPETK